MKFFIPLILALMLAGCASKTADTSEEAALPPESLTAEESVPGEITSEEPTVEEANIEKEQPMKLSIEGVEVLVTWEENASVEALRALCPLTIELSMYGGFEQVGPIGQSIVREDEQLTTQYGDIVLYSGNQIVLFYGSNSWAYTKLGHMDLSEQELRDRLGGGDVSITLQ